MDSSQAYQQVEGFGYTLTERQPTWMQLQKQHYSELFGSASNSIGISYLRVSIRASDLSSSVFSYDDMPVGQTDPTLANFSLSQDLTDWCLY